MKKRDIRRKMVVVMTGTCPLGKFLLYLELCRRQFRIFADLEDFTENFDKGDEKEQAWEYALILYMPFSYLERARRILSTSFEFHQVSVNAYRSSPEDLPAEQYGSSAAFCSHGSTAEVYDQFDRYFVWGNPKMVRR